MSNARNIAAFLTGYAAAYSLVIAGVRFTGLFALNHFFGLGLSVGIILLVVYAAHLMSHSWQAGVAQGVERHKHNAMRKLVAESQKKAEADVERAAEYNSLDPEQRRTLN